MKFSKVIGALIALVQLASALGLVVGMHSMLGVFSTAMSSGEQGIEIQFTDPVVVPFNLSPRNSGFVDATLEIRIAMIVDGVEVSYDSATVSIPAHSTVPVDLELSVPLEDAEEYFQEGTELQWETDIRVMSLFDLISFSNNMVM
ncbi:MAG: hypothetical protein NWF07_03910, partial [Candidatus Bathyarchaeota archaeon]|nr:hypothetical protein [Candidatus Bathyarchaeota archaeon]